MQSMNFHSTPAVTSWRLCTMRLDCIQPGACAISQGTNVLYDGLAEVPIRLIARKYKPVRRVQMSRMRMALAAVAQSGSDATCPGHWGTAGRATRVSHGDIQQAGPWGGEWVTSMSVRAPWPPGAATPTEVNLGSVRTLQPARAKFRLRASPAVIQEVVVHGPASPANAIVTHGVVDVAALDVMTAKAGGGGGHVGWCQWRQGARGNC
jgi:hypothetical protein